MKIETHKHNPVLRTTIFQSRRLIKVLATPVVSVVLSREGESVPALQGPWMYDSKGWLLASVDPDCVIIYMIWDQTFTTCLVASQLQIAHAMHKH